MAILNCLKMGLKLKTLITQGFLLMLVLMEIILNHLQIMKLM